MSESSFSWADDVIEEVESQQNAGRICKHDNKHPEMTDDYPSSPLPSPIFTDQGFDNTPNTTANTSPTEESVEWVVDGPSNVVRFWTEYNQSSPATRYQDADMDNNFGDENYGHDTPSHDENGEPRSPSPEQEGMYLADAIEAGRFDEWAKEALEALEEGTTSVRELYLRHLSQFKDPYWREDALPSTPIPKYSNGNAADPRKLLELFPLCSRSYEGLVTYEDIGDRANRQGEMELLGIKEREVSKTWKEMQALKYSGINRSICKPSKLRNCWTVVSDE